MTSSASSRSCSSAVATPSTVCPVKAFTIRATAQVLQQAGFEFGLMNEQWCCDGPAAEMGYVEQSRAFAEHNLADWRASGVKQVIAIEPHDYIHFVYKQEYVRPEATRVSDGVVVRMKPYEV
jgi:Fe-S oxidoreductase